MVLYCVPVSCFSHSRSVPLLVAAVLSDTEENWETSSDDNPYSKSHSTALFLILIQVRMSSTTMPHLTVNLLYYSIHIIISM